MGYSEVLCHICGVSFNIGRIRTPGEPREAAWSRFGPMIEDGSQWDVRLDRQGSYVDGRTHWDDCNRNSGCMFTIRKVKDEGREYTVDSRGKRGIGEKLTHEEDEENLDENWKEQSENDEDETDQGREENFLEYCSDDETLDDHDSDTEVEDIGRADNRNPVDRAWIRDFLLQGTFEDRESLSNFIRAHEAYPAWYSGIPDYIPADNGRNIVDDLFPRFYAGRDDASEHGSDASFEGDLDDHNARLYHRSGGKLGYHHMDQHEVEHIAGQGCRNEDGYSGHVITVDEMRGCQIVQCLVRKPKGWHFEPLPDDENFERTEEFFLSGLSDHMPSRDMSYPRVHPARHGCEQPHAENCIWQPDDAADYAIPFHPPCFEIFKRVSSLLSGKIDIVGLTDWWGLEARYDDFHAFPRDPNVKKCRDQEWSHRKGTEYLVANPLYIPRLKAIFSSSIEKDECFDPRNGAFSGLKRPDREFMTDPFIVFPAELRFEILHYLPSKDIANLRLSSSSFYQLPVAFFQKLIVRELPWLWEAWPTHSKLCQEPYSIWACRPSVRARTEQDEADRKLAVLNDYIQIVKKEMPELGPQLDEAFPAEFQFIQDELLLKIESNEDRKPFYLPPDRTNYFTLYTLITRHWNELRGLQNRRRIWKDCEEILRRVKNYREEGRIENME